MTRVKRLPLGSHTPGAPAPVLRAIVYHHVGKGPGGRGHPLPAVTFGDDLHMLTAQVFVLFQQLVLVAPYFYNNIYIKMVRIY